MIISCYSTMQKDPNEFEPLEQPFFILEFSHDTTLLLVKFNWPL